MILISWAGATYLCIKVGWHSTIALLAWYSIHQLPGCEWAVKRPCTPLRCLNAACISMYSHIQLCIYALKCIYKIQIHIYTLLHLFTCLYVLLFSYIRVHIYIYIYIYMCVFWFTFGLVSHL